MSCCLKLLLVVAAVSREVTAANITSKIILVSKNITAGGNSTATNAAVMSDIAIAGTVCGVFVVLVILLLMFFRCTKTGKDWCLG